MKKKLIGLAMLVTLAAMQVMGVSAAGSKTTGMAVTGDSKGSYAFEDMSAELRLLTIWERQHRRSLLIWKARA